MPPQRKATREPWRQEYIPIEINARCYVNDDGIYVAKHGSDIRAAVLFCIIDAPVVTQEPVAHEIHCI